MAGRRLGILISGRGSNFIAIADSIAAGRLDAEIAIVISNKPEAAGLKTARERGIQAIAIPHKGMERAAHDQAVIDALRAAEVDLVVLAGYMRLFTPIFLKAFPKVLNIHPSLLPSFPGLHSQQQAIEHGVKISGCTVHFMADETDSGPIIRQAAVPVLGEDTAETLEARILKEEHRIYSEAIALILSGRYRIEGRRVIET